MKNNTDRPFAERYFYSIASILLLGLTMAGFQLFYFHGQAYPGRPLTPQTKHLVVIHAVAMSLWMVISVIQPFLVASGNRRKHMALGRIAAFIAVALVVLGLLLAIAACKVAPPGLMYGALTPRQFMAVPVLNIVMFALFVAAGVFWRKRTEIHKPVMFVATLTAVAAAISRTDFFNHLYADTVWEKIFGVFVFSVVIAGLFFAAKCIVFRRFDFWFAVSCGMMAIGFLIIAQIAPTPAWDAIAGFLLK
ncbi:MAG: hypothetical protein WEB60_02900 [Terrimicrobiaceae bacterium]